MLTLIKSVHSVNNFLHEKTSLQHIAAMLYRFINPIVVVLITIIITLFPQSGFASVGNSLKFGSNPFENRCGSVETTKSGAIHHSPSTVIQPNERCVWTIAVPRATGYIFQVYYLGDQVKFNTDQYYVAIHELHRGRAPRRTPLYDPF